MQSAETMISRNRAAWSMSQQQLQEASTRNGRHDLLLMKTLRISRLASDDRERLATLKVRRCDEVYVLGGEGFSFRSCSTVNAWKLLLYVWTPQAVEQETPVFPKGSGSQWLATWDLNVPHGWLSKFWSLVGSLL